MGRTDQLRLTEKPCANCGHHRHCDCPDEGKDEHGFDIGCCTPGGCWEWLPPTPEQIASSAWITADSRLGCPCRDYVAAPDA